MKRGRQVLGSRWHDPPRFHDPCEQGRGDEVRKPRCPGVQTLHPSAAWKDEVATEQSDTPGPWPCSSHPWRHGQMAWEQDPEDGLRAER